MSVQRTLAASAAVLAIAQVVGGVSASAATNPAPVSALSSNVNTPVIVMLRDQPAMSARARDTTITTAQAPLLSELSQVHAQHVRAYRLVNAVAATVSAAEAARLATDPAVAEVVPDQTVHLPMPRTTPAKAAAPRTQVAPGICPAQGKTMLEPEALSATNTDSDDPAARTARSLGLTGAGVKVASIADGMDITNPDFIRPDGSSAFAGYEDFSGEGPTAPTYGAESFLDYSSIAAQGTAVHNIQNFSAQALPAPCNIRIEGVAPGASLYAYKILGNNDTFSLSAALEAIDYAVNTDHVNVINESFGTYPVPDTTADDMLKLANDNAVAAGVTVTVASFDSGTANTIGSPATDPKVITVGASTTFRFDEQTNYAGAATFGSAGWINDNVSPLTSSGFTADARTIDLLAPGDQSFVPCTPDPTIYQACVSFAGKPSDVQLGGGTSEASPLTAGAAALVIQAYRKTHNNASPSPALIKSIITGTADDLTEPGDEQGAGLLDTYRAAQAALSIKDANGSPAPVGNTVQVNQDQFSATGAPGSAQRFQVQVTNTGATAQTVKLSNRTFAAPVTVDDATATLADTGPHFTDWTGVPSNYAKLTFTVPASTPRLSASIAYPGNPSGNPNGMVRMDLIDPQGRFATDSLPQGVGNYGNADVRFPAPGTWTAVIMSPESTQGGTTGTVTFHAVTQATTTTGTVSPASLTLAPGQSGTATLSTTTPASPGDASSSLVLDSGGARTSVPVVLRGLVPATGGGAFSGTLTGGNGRQTDIGQNDFYQIDVPAGKHDLDAHVNVPTGAGEQVLAYLINPRGTMAAIGGNTLTTSYTPATHAATQQTGTATDLYTRDPVPGRWTLIVNFPGAITGDRTAQPFTGSLTFDQVDIAAAGLPDSTATTLPAGQSRTFDVTVHNTGTAPQDYFVDPRLTGFTTLPLAAVSPATVPLPQPYSKPEPEWLVPSETNGLTASATSTVPASFDYGTLTGDPDLAASRGTSPTGSTTGRPLPAGPWLTSPIELGTFGQGGAPAGQASFTMNAVTRAFDPAIAAAPTDLWATAAKPVSTFHIITVDPGQTAQIPIIVTPTGAKGSTVTGTLFVNQLSVTNVAELNMYMFYDFNPFEPYGNELVGIPYQYTVG